MAETVSPTEDQDFEVEPGEDLIAEAASVLELQRRSERISEHRARGAMLNAQKRAEESGTMQDFDTADLQAPIMYNRGELVTNPVGTEPNPSIDSGTENESIVTETSGDTESSLSFADPEGQGEFESAGKLMDLVPTPTEFAKGVAGGALEAIPAAIHGIIETIPDMISMLNNLDAAANKQLLAAGVPVEQNTFADITRENAPELLYGWQENTEKTVIGNGIREITNFIAAAGMVGGKIRGSKFIVELAKKAPKTASLAANAITGAIAEFAVVDTLDTSLREAVKANPELQGGFLEWWGGDEDDTALDQRMRSAIMGSAFQVVGDTLFTAMKAARQMIRTRVALTRASKEAAKKVGGFKDPLKEGEAVIAGPQISSAEASISGFSNAVDDAGNTLVGNKLVRVVSNEKAAQRIAKAQEELEKRFPKMDPAELRARASSIESDLEINFDRLSFSDDLEADVKQLINDASALDLDALRAARRETVDPVTGKTVGVSNAKTSEAADRLDIGIKDVLSRNVGQVPTPAEITGYRRVWVSMAETVEGLARTARVSGSDIDNYKFRKALAVFNAVNQSVLGARAEAGRAVQAWRIKVEGNSERAQILSALVENSGGSRVNAKLAETFLNAVDAGYSPGQINAIMERGWFAKSVDMVKESAVVGMLWLPSTQIANITSNANRIATSIMEKAVASRIGHEMMTEDGVVVGEAMAQYRGTIAAARAIWRGGAERDELSLVTRNSVASAGNKIDQRMNSISAEAWGLDETHGLGKFVETFGNAVRTPARFLERADDTFKMAAFAGEREAQAFRMATREMQASGGKMTDAQFSVRYADLINNPPESIRLASGNAALYSTFTQQAGTAAQALFKVRDAVPLGYLIWPFVKTPMNVLRYEFEFSPLAPLVGQWRADVRAGGAARDIALARLAIGTVTTLSLADFSFEGKIHGPLSTKPGVRDAQIRAGIQPDSIDFGDTNVRINRLSPLGINASLTAALTELMTTHQFEEEDFTEAAELFAQIATATSASVLDKSFFAGSAQLMAALQDPERRGSNFVKQLVKNIIPFSSAVRGINTLIDPTRRESFGVYDSILQGIVALEQRLVPARNVWGELIERHRVDVVNPFQARNIDASPIDIELVNEKINFQRIGRRSSFQGVDINFANFPNVLDAYVQLAGNGVKIDGNGMKAALNERVREWDYRELSHGPNGGRAFDLNSRRAGFNALAQLEIMEDPDGKYRTEEFREFRKYVEEKRLRNMNDRIPSEDNFR